MSAPALDRMPPTPAGSGDLTHQLAEIVAQVSRVMDAEGCTIYLHDEARNEIWSRVMTSTQGPLEIRLKVGEGIAGKVMETGETLNIADAKHDRRHAGQFDREGFVTRSVLCLPLVNSRGTRVGVVQVINKRGGPFTAADETLLAALNSQVAIALENARLAADLSAAQKAESDLAAELAEKHKELQGAYQRLESAKVEAETNLRRIQLLRLGAIIGAVVLFAALGIVSTRGGHIARNAASGPAPAAANADARKLFTVVTRKTQSGIPLQSSFEPLRTVRVIAGLGGTISELHFHYGQRVTAGDLLLEIDTTTEEVALREARVEVIRAEETVRELEGWREGAAVSDARRAVTRSQSAQRDAERRASESERLFAKGIVGGDELAAAKRELESATLEMSAVEQELARALAQGGENNLRIARMALQNAKVAESRSAARIAEARVRAPVSGVVLLPRDKAEGERGPASGITTRSEVSAGSLLLQIGEISGLTLGGSLDEVEIAAVHLGQKVLVTSAALPDLHLEGTVIARASQGRWDDRARGHRFDVVVEIPVIPAAWADRVLLGMSASMEILLGDDEPKLLVPVGAVHLEGASAWVERVDPKTGSSARRPVTPGLTTIDAVEITSGLAEGDQIVVP